MIDETPQPAAAGAGTAAESQDPVSGYCQQCGRSLTTSSQRRVGAGIFCEPCAAIRTGQAPGWRPVATGASASYTGTSRTRGLPSQGEPNPLLAGFLGLIPGVGAMFNGQYAKGVIHLIVFVVLVSLADNLNWVLWWFVWGWVFYQGFEAYHTAQARRDGQPLPDPFGWNELGDRLGFGHSWSSGPPSAARSPTPPQPAPTGYAAQTASGAVPFTQVNSDPYTAPLAGFPPVSPVPPPPVPPFAASGNDGPMRTPYTPTYTGTASQPSGQAAVLLGSRKFPIAAAWLIGLGILFLLGNLLPTWHIDGRWLVPILLAAIALWTGGSRLFAGTQGSTTGPPPNTNVAGLLLGPAMLLTIAVLIGLQDASLAYMKHSWPVLLIVWGGLLLLQRAEQIRRRSPAEGPLSLVTPTGPAPQTPLR